MCQADGPYFKDRNLFRLSTNEVINLNEKFMVFCMGQADQSQFALYLFSGIIGSLLFVPSISDKYGRKNVVSMCLAASVVAHFGLIMSETFDYALYSMALLGVAWLGKLLVGITCILEFLPSKVRLRYTIYILLF